MTKHKYLLESVVNYLGSTDSYNTINENYIDQARKNEIAANVRKVVPKLPYKSSVTLGIAKNYTVLVAKIKSSELLADLYEIYQDGNTGYTGGPNHKPKLRSDVEDAMDDKNFCLRINDPNPSNLFKGSTPLAKKLYKYFNGLEEAIKSTGWELNDFYITLEIYRS